MTITEFLRARLDDDEAKARAAHGATWVASRRGGVVDLDDAEGHEIAGRDGGLAWPDADFMAHHDPARVLREVAAKRRLVDQWADRYDDNPHATSPEAADAADVLHTLASVYSDHPDYQRQWAPHQ